VALSARIDHGIHYAELTPDVPSERCFLLLHGLGGSFRFWTAVAPVLGASHRTLAIDLPGFGASDLPVGELTIDAVAVRVVDFCRQVGVRDCVVVAHSLGGLIGARVAAQDPGLFTRRLGNPHQRHGDRRMPGVPSGALPGLVGCL